MTEREIQGSRVYSKGAGKSYNCINKITANDLYNTLTTYENTHTLNKNIEEQYDRITKQIIQIQLSLGILTEEIQKLKTTMEAIK
jgi:peptidoglycan hydrolase CwlO-like protein